MTLFDALGAQEAEQLPRLAIRGATGGIKGYLLARLLAEHKSPLLVVTSDARQRDLLYHDLCCFLADFSPSTSPTCVYRYIYPTSDAHNTLAYQQQRVLTTFQPLWRLYRAEPIIVIAEATSLGYGVLPPEQLERCLLSIRVGELHMIDRLGMDLIQRGYRRVPLVEGIGEFSIRGGILDLFSPGQAYPWRLEFFGDEIETMRTFETASQVSNASLSCITIAPMHPLHQHCLEQTSSVKYLRRHLSTHGWDAALIAACLERWQAQHPAAWPWGIDTFFYERLCSPLAYLPASGVMCCVDVEDTFFDTATDPSFSFYSARRAYGTFAARTSYRY